MWNRLTLLSLYTHRQFITLGLSRMESTKNCTLFRYHLMLECWHQNPGMRPCFSRLVQDLDRILAISVHDVSSLSRSGIYIISNYICLAASNITASYIHRLCLYPHLLYFVGIFGSRVNGEYFGFGSLGQPVFIDDNQHNK